tara:strand:- start:5158 stop:5427 length:270 start_codon:yes stop_codon:yes gene_type:complete
MYYLYSTDYDTKIATFKRFNHDEVKAAIFNHFTKEENRLDILEWTKEDLNLETVGDDIIDFYGINPRTTSSVCKLVFRGKKTFYRKLTK